MSALSPTYAAKEHVLRIEHSGRFHPKAEICCGEMGIAFDALFFQTKDDEIVAVDDNDKIPSVAGEGNTDIEWFGEWKHHHAGWLAEKGYNLSFSWTHDGGWDFQDLPAGALEYTFTDDDGFTHVWAMFNVFNNNGIFNLLIDGELIAEVDEYAPADNAGPGYTSPVYNIEDILSVEPANKLAATWGEIKRRY